MNKHLLRCLEAASKAQRRRQRRISDRISSRNITRCSPCFNHEPTVSTEKILLGTSDVRDLIAAETIYNTVKDGLSILTEKFTIHSKPEEVAKFLKEILAPKAKNMFSNGENSTIAMFKNCWIEIVIHHNTTDVFLNGDSEFNSYWKAEWLTQFDEVTAVINWMYDVHGSTISVPIDTTLLPCEEMYPFLSKPLDEYYDDFINSNASIVILIGPPGTGKTSWIRGFLNKMKSTALVTYDQKILEGDSIFSSFIEGSESSLVVEDADMFLSSRKDGNTMMHKFLNVGDGLVTVKGKKMIFSTNLPSAKDIDEALLRPGRCFDIIQFRNLYRDEAMVLSEKINLNYPFNEDDRQEYSLAELFSKTKHRVKYRGTRVGFLGE